jgi:organic hydroperoxide reductase OsmC/OhrA
MEDRDFHNLQLQSSLIPLTSECTEAKRSVFMAMEDTLRFRVIAWWASGRTGLAKSSSAPNAIHFTAAPAFGGLEGRWTPEDLLLGAVASSYTTTFRAVAENSKFEFTDLQVEVEAGITSGETGYNLGPLIIRANLMIQQEAEQDRAAKILQEAERLCLVGRALSAERKFESTVKVIEARTEKSLSASVMGSDAASDPKKSAIVL